MSNEALNRAVRSIADEQPILLAQFNAEELRQRMEQFVAQLLALGRQREVEGRGE